MRGPLRFPSFVLAAAIAVVLASPAPGASPLVRPTLAARAPSARQLARLQASAGAGVAQLGGRSAPDPAGNTFVTWVDTRGPWGSSLWVQKLDAAGVPQWTEGGTPVSVDQARRSDPSVVSDGAGGVWVVWENDLADDMLSTDICVQWFDAAGTAQLAANGLAIGAAANRQIDPQAVSDGAGGIVVAWSDRRASIMGDIYAQRVTTDGTPAWTANGIAICTAANDQSAPRLCTDGNHGAIVVWTDQRVSETEEAIYAQWVNRFGAVQWTANGLPVTTTWTEQFSPVVGSDGAGGAIVAWVDLSPTFEADLRAQRFAANGTRRWGANGAVVCSATDTQMAPIAVEDGANGLIVAWTDYRGDLDGDFYAQRVDSTGAGLWTANGAVLCDDPSGGGSLDATTDGAGGAIFAWRDQRASQPFDLYGQRLDSNGAPQWGTNGMSLSAAFAYEIDPQVSSDGAGGAVVTWYDTRSRQDQDVFAQRVSAAGALLWTANGVPVYEHGPQLYPAVCAGGAGSTFVTWWQKRNGEYDIMARKVDAAGHPLSPTVAVCTAPDLQFWPVIAPDGAGGAILAWYDQRGGANHSAIYAQRLDANGALQWAADGVAMSEDTSSKSTPQIVGDGLGNAIIVWEARHAGLYRVRAQKVNPAGVPLWGDAGLQVADDAVDQTYARAASDGAGGAIVLYQHGPDDPPLYTLVQRVDSTGARPWGAFGTGLNHAGWMQMDPSIAADGLGGAVVSWSDYSTGQFRIFAHRVRANGTTLWGSDGVMLTTGVEWQGYSHVLSDGAGGAFVAFTRAGVGGVQDIAAQRVDSTGARLWSNGGRTVCQAADSQLEPRLAPDGADGVFVTWGDYRSGADWGVYAQHLDATGAAQWTADGIVVADSAWNQWAARPLADGSGGMIVAWHDERVNGRGHVAVQRFDAAGNALWSAGGVVPTAWSLVRMRATSEVAHLEWWAANSASLVVAVQRREPAGEWQELGTLNGDGTGLFVYDDPAITPGARYAYRIVAVGGTQASAETWVDVPLRARLALAGTWPNPVRRDLRVAFALTGAGPTRLELLDVAGRLVRHWSLVGFGAGQHAVALGDAGEFAPGVYVLRLTEGRATAQRRVTIVR
ncbi:MAG: hypothetical protein U0704_00195 [Candidatus Eisenbacteria bacterium]